MKTDENRLRKRENKGKLLHIWPCPHVFAFRSPIFQTGYRNLKYILSQTNKDNFKSSSLTFQRKFFIYYVIGLLVAICLFVLAAFLVDRRTVVCHEQMFNEQQALQTLLAKRAMEGRINEIKAKAEFLARHSLPELIQGRRIPASFCERNLLATEGTVYGEVLLYLYLKSPGCIEHAQVAGTADGTEAKRVFIKWADEYWSQLETAQQSPVVPPFHVTAEYQMFGMLFPIRIKEKMQGVMVVVVDLKPMVKRYIAPLRSGKYGAGYLLDGRGIVVYDHETQIIGRSIFDGMHASYPDLMRVDRLLVSESSGMEEYHFTVKRSDRISRKLIAWHALDVCGKKLVIALSAPDMEINKIVSEFRLHHLILGGSFGLALLGMSILFFRARQQLREQSTKEIRELERLVNIQDKMSSLGCVAAGIAHEIRNPLSTINVYLSALQRVCGDIENLEPNAVESIKESIEEMGSASNKIESVVRRVIDFSRPNKPKLRLTDINKCIRKTVDLSAISLRKMGIKMKTVFDDDLPECWLDSQSIAQVMLNLITNAAEAMEGIKGHKQIEISTSYSNKFITVIVSDSGPGVPADIQDKIFDPFYTTKKNGSGIGLGISHRIISDHSGFLNVSQSKWVGAEFTIKLPIEKRTGRI